jgi:RNA polymerase sigma-70 factor (ECF subfamily)
MEKNEEKRLIEDFLNGNEAAFNILVRNYQNKIYWFARRMLGNHSDADEVTQEVLITLYEKLHTFKFESSLSTWIYKITSSKSLNLIRKQKVREYFSLDTVFNQSSDGDILKDLESKEKLELVEKALSKLPSKQRQIFVLRHFEGLSYKEISEITGKAVGTLKTNYFHAINKITELIENEK